MVLKNIKTKVDWDNVSFTDEKTFKTGNKKKRKWMKMDEKEEKNLISLRKYFKIIMYGEQ